MLFVRFKRYFFVPKKSSKVTFESPADLTASAKEAKKAAFVISLGNFGQSCTSGVSVAYSIGLDSSLGNQMQLQFHSKTVVDSWETDSSIMFNSGSNTYNKEFSIDLSTVDSVRAYDPKADEYSNEIPLTGMKNCL